MDQAKAQNIPVIAFDSGVDSDVPVTTAATDNKAAAAEAAKHMAELIGDKGKVAMVVHDQTSRHRHRPPRRLRRVDEGERARTSRSSPSSTAAATRPKSADIAKSIIAANPDLKGFYGANEGSAIGVVKGVQESGKKGTHDRRLRLRQGPDRRHQERRHGRRHHAEPGRHRQGARRRRR